MYESSRDPYRILLVDDRADTVLVMEKLLQQRGYIVHSECTVAGGLERARQNRIDLLLTDIVLPDGTGIDLHSKINALRPVVGIAISGYGMPKDIHRSLNAGFALHLVKPLDLEHFFDAVQRVCEDCTRGKTQPDRAALTTQILSA